MISKTDILQLVRNVVRAQAGIVSRTRFVNPKREWFWIISIAAVLFVVMVIALLAQSHILNGNRYTEAVPYKTETYDERAAAAVITQFTARVQEQDSYEATLVTGTAQVDGKNNTATNTVANTTTTIATSTNDVATSTTDVVSTSTVTGTGEAD